MDAIQAYLDHLATHGAPARCRAARADLRGLVRWWEATHRQPFDVGQLAQRDLVAWRRHRQVHDGAAATTINRGLSTMR